MGNMKSRIAVIGDVALDFYYFTHTSEEISVETGLGINFVDNYSYGPGGAGNLAVNIARLGAQCDLYGMRGDDIWADILIKSLNSFNVNVDGFIPGKDFTTFVYHKIYNSSDEELPRYDFGAKNIYAKEDIDRLFAVLEKKLEEYQAIVINQQFSNSLHTEYFKKKLTEILAKVKIPVWMDSREHISYPNCSYKMNISEARAHSGKESVEDCAIELYKANPGSSIIITLGENGALGFDGREICEVNGINAIWPVDTVGAGDAFLSGLIFSLSHGCGLEESMVFANGSAAVSTKTLRGTGHPTLKETQELLAEADYRINPELSEDLRLACYISGTDIEIVNKDMDFSFPKAAIFDHDGTVSTMRLGWEKVMRDVMIKEICGEKLDILPSDKINAIYKDIDVMIEKTTGIQTIVQMQQLVDMIYRYGYVPEKSIKTALEYKKIYTKRLNDMIKSKYQRIKEGINSVDDYTMKDSLKFIRSLNDRNVSVFLASGTDLEDVCLETETFGTTSLFSGGVFGSVGDVSNDPKKIVMRNIIKQIDAKPKEVVVFGDGPVEIREGKRHGFLTVGVLSDEKQRFGINYAKRKRLVLAGADILIPDFSWMEKVEEYLGWN